MERLPSLMQRAYYRENTSRKGIDAFFDFDYMGASEFEWGTLPRSLKIMREARMKARDSSQTADWKVEVLTVGPYTAYYVGRPDDKTTAEALVADQLLNRPQHRTKERTAMREAFGLDPEWLEGSKPFDAWWAVDAGWDSSHGSTSEVPFVIFRKKEHAEKWLEVL